MLWFKALNFIIYLDGSCASTESCHIILFSVAYRIHRGQHPFSLDLNQISMKMNVL